MDLEQLIERLTTEGVRLKPPIRLRRKPKKADTAKGSWASSPAGKASLKERQRKYRAGTTGTWKKMSMAYKRRHRLRTAKGGTYSEWKLTLPEWQSLWAEAGFVTTPLGQRMLAFSLRGKSKQHVKMMRIEEAGHWELSNVVIMYNGRVIANGRALSSKKA